MNHKTTTKMNQSPGWLSKAALLCVALVSLLSVKSEASNGALNFDGSNCYVDIGYVLPGGHSYTKEAWIKANQSSTHNIITGDDDPFWLSGDHLRAAHGWQSIPNDIQDPETFPLGVWVYVAVTYDAATSTMKLYKNGIEVASSNTMSSYGTTYLQVGAYNSSNLFDGDIDEVRVWDRALCVTEIQAHMNCELQGTESGLLVYYKFNEGILGAINTLITSATDASGHGNNGTLHNFLLTGATSNFVTGITPQAYVNYNPPVSTATAAGATSVNQGSSVTLNANAASQYQWQKNSADINGATDQSYTATTSGNYAVRITNEFGCSNVSAAVPVSVSAVMGSITAPADITACDDQTGNSKTLTLTTTGLNSPVTTYAITGATTGSGTGTSVTKNFNKGVSTIAWTVVAGGTTYKATANVSILELPVVTITTSKPDVFCDELAVMAKSSHTSGTNTYAWTYNNASYASSQIINLDNTQSDGNYYVKTTDQQGCVSNSASYNYLKQNMINSYTMLAYKSIDLESNNDILSGGIGVINWGGTIDMDWAGSLPSTGFAKASNLSISCYATVAHKYYSTASGIALPTMLSSSASANNLSTYTKTSSGTVNNNYKLLTINSNLNVTVNGTLYHKIKINSNATVTFTAADIALDSLDISDNATVIFNQGTNLRVSKAVTIGRNVTLNSTAQKVTFFMSDAVSDIIKFSVDNNCNITANVFMPKGKLSVNDASNNDCWKNTHGCHAHNHNNCNNDHSSTFMIGFYICERIEAGTNVTWDNFTCVDVPVGRQTNHGPIATFSENEISSVNVFPNPSNGIFRIALPTMTSNADVKIYDITGKLLISKSVAQDEARMMDINMENVAKGMYLVEVKGTGISYKSKIVIE